MREGVRVLLAVGVIFYVIVISSMLAATTIDNHNLRHRLEHTKLVLTCGPGNDPSQVIVRNVDETVERDGKITTVFDIGQRTIPNNKSDVCIISQADNGE